MADLTPQQQATLESWRVKLESEQPDGTFVGNPEDARSFYQFSNGVTVLQPCPAGLIFNASLGVCDYPVAVSLDENPAPGR